MGASRYCIVVRAAGDVGRGRRVRERATVIGEEEQPKGKARRRRSAGSTWKHMVQPVTITLHSLLPADLYLLFPPSPSLGHRLLAALLRTAPPVTFFTPD